MLIPSLVIVSGLALLLWSAEKFVEGSATTARYFKMPPLLIGMVIVGFGTSAPEMMVSGFASWQGSSGIALGNAYGSNITNIALILGLTALINPISFHSQVLKKELPILSLISLFAIWQLWDGLLSRSDAVILMLVFMGLMAWTVRQSLSQRVDPFAQEVERELSSEPFKIQTSVVWTIVGLAFLLLSSRLLVWGATEVAAGLGVSDLVIGLTIVAIGTSLPELASSLVASRRGEHDIALGNVLGSNLFNTLAVVGIAGLINPISVDSMVLHRDTPVMLALTFSLFVMGFGFRGPGRINRFEGSLLLAGYVAYTAFLF